MKRFTCQMKLLIPTSLVMVMSCSPKAPPPPPGPTPRQATAVPAPFARTWDAVISHFAASSIPIKVIDRSSGLIVTEVMSVGPRDAADWSWCAWESDYWHKKALARAGQEPKVNESWVPVGADQASYNVLVKGDSTASSVRVTVRWTYVDIFEPRERQQRVECQSRDVYERDLEKLISERAARLIGD